jgi:hypothetical protein
MVPPMLDTLFHLILILPEQAQETLKLFKTEQCSSAYQGALDVKDFQFFILLFEELNIATSLLNS